MEQDIRSIMELVAKGVITPEEGEKMIKELDKQGSFTYQAKEQARSFGEKVGDSIDNIVPKTKSMFKKGFDATAEFSQKMSDKLAEDRQNAKDKTTEFNEKVSNEYQEGKQNVKDKTTEFNEKVSNQFEEGKQKVNETTEKVSNKVEEEKNDVKEATTEFNEKVSTKFEEGKQAVDEGLDKVFKKEEEEEIDFSYLNDIEPIFKDAGDEVEPVESTSEEIIDLITSSEQVVQETIGEMLELEKEEGKQ